MQFSLFLPSAFNANSAQAPAMMTSKDHRPRTFFDCLATKGMTTRISPSDGGPRYCRPIGCWPPCKREVAGEQLYCSLLFALRDDFIKVFLCPPVRLVLPSTWPDSLTFVTIPQSLLR